MVEDDDLMSFIRMQQFEINFLANEITKDNVKPRFKYHDIIKHINNFLNKKNYYNRLIMIPGLRGVGKSTLLYQIYHYLNEEKAVAEDDILYINVDDLKSSIDTDIKTVFEIFIENVHNTIPLTLKKKIFLLVDEAQFDKKWANFAKLLFDKNPRIFMIFTGSSALNLNINTDATRRITTLRLYPCNFREYLYLKHDIKLDTYDLRELILNTNHEIVEKAINYEKEIYKELYSLPNDNNIELKKYIHTQSFPFALDNEEIEVHKLTYEVIKRIIKDDLVEFKSYNKLDDKLISRILTFIATKKSGKTSNNKIAQYVGISANTVDNLLDILEKTELLFKIYAYGSASTLVKKPREHFFITPSIKATLNYRIGRYNLNNKKCYSLLVENMIASTLNILVNDASISLGLFYDPNKKGVDFLLKCVDDLIPIEVGIGKKTKSQLTIAINKYHSKYGILISNRTDRIKYENDILYIPLVTFALMF
jgi:hypothetical protein